MRPVWPASLPQHVSREGFQYVAGDSRLPRPTDAGSTRIRRRLSFVPDTVRCSMKMTQAQRDTCEAFLEDALKGHVLPFNFPSIPPGRPAWVVQIGQNMPAWSPVGNGWRVDLDLVRLK